jgi:hypothetical protein
MKIYFYSSLFTHYIPLDGHNVTLIAHSHNSILILLQGILLLVTSSFPKQSGGGVIITFSDSSTSKIDWS